MIMMLLINVGINFWVGSLFWPTFVLPFIKQENQAQQTIMMRTEQRFERYFALPTLLFLLIFHIAIVSIPTLFSNTIEAMRLFPQPFQPSGSFVHFWIARIAILLVALAVTLFLLLFKHRLYMVENAVAWINVALGLALLVVVALSQDTTDVGESVGSVLGSWLQVFSTSLCIGGLLYIAVVYLPVLKGDQQEEQGRSLLSVLPCAFPLLGIGIVGTLLSAVFDARIHANAWGQLFSTLYGRILLIQGSLMSVLLVISAIQIFRLYPHLARAYMGHLSAQNLLQQAEPQEKHMMRLSFRLIASLRWEAFLGIAVLFCSSLLPFVANTLHATVGDHGQTQKVIAIKPFTTTAKTTDGLFTVIFTVNPNRSGANTFIVSIQDNKGIATTQVRVLLSTRMLEMDMGTDTIVLLPDGKGHLSGNGDLGMSGVWLVRVQIQTTDGILHEVIIRFVIPS